MKSLAVFTVFTLPLMGETLDVSTLGSSGDLGQVVRAGDLSIAAPSGSQLHLGETSVPSASLGIAGSFSDETVSEEETLHFTFHAPARIDGLTLAGFGNNDMDVILGGFPADPGASLSNGTTSWSNGLLRLTPTSFADLATVTFSSPRVLTRLVLSNADAIAGADGVGLNELEYTIQPRKLYRELFPNGIREDRDLSTAGWDASAASEDPVSPPDPVVDPVQTTVNVSSLGSGNLGTSASSGGLDFTGINGDLFRGTLSGFDSLGVDGAADTGDSFRSTESITVTPNAEGMALRSVTLTGAGVNDSPVTISGFITDPIATITNGTVSYVGGTLTVNFTSFATAPVLTVSNDAVGVSLTFLCSGQDSANGVGIHAITYSTATGLPGGTPAFDQAAIAGVIGDDHAYVSDLSGGEDLKAMVTTESDTIDFDPADFSSMEMRWEQAGAANGDNVSVRALVQVGTQWYASSAAFATGGNDEPLTGKVLALDLSTPDWLPASLGENMVTLGTATTPATGEITNLGLLVDFSTDGVSEDQVIWFDDVELCGIPNPGVSVPWTFVSMPDFTNADIGDVSGAITGVPEASGWDGGQNGTTVELEDSFAGLLDAMASEAPDFAMIAGDSLEGEWFKDAAGRQILGPVGNASNRELAWVEGSFYFYGHLVNEWLLSRGMEPIVAIGDHEYGDNDWGTGGNNTALIPLMRSEFGRWFSRFPRGQWDTYVTSPPAEAGRPDRTSPDFKQANAPFLWPDRPVGTGYEETAYAVRHKDTLIVSIDVFYQDTTAAPTFLYPYGNSVTATLGPTGDTQYTPTPDLGQLAWLEALLADAKNDPSIKHIIVQGHTPILQPVLTTASSGMTFRDGEESSVWQSFIANGVDLYFCGETHDIAASRHQGVQQINHGSPPGSRVLNYLVGRVHADRIELTLKTGRQYRDNTVPYWQPEDGNGKSGFAEIREPFAVMDQIIIDKSGPEDVITDGTGLLANIESDDLLIHYPFDEVPGTRQMSNQGTLPDLNADGARKWRGDLDNAWLSATDFSAGEIGSALSFAGVSGNPDAIISGGCPTPLSKPRTVAFWLKTTQEGFMAIAGFGDQSKTMSNFNIQKDTSNQLRVAIGNSDNTLAVGSPVLNDGQWHHCAVVVPGWNSRLNELRFFVDGVFYPADNTSTQTIITRTTSSVGKLRLGRNTHNTSSPLQGSLDDFVIWGRALSDAEVRLLCEFGKSTFSYDAGQVDLILKAFRDGTGVTVGSQIWFYIGEDLRGNPGTVYDTASSETIVPLESGVGFATTGNVAAIRIATDSIELNEGAGTLTITWNSLNGATYTVRSSDTLAGDPLAWSVEEAGIASQGTTTTTTFPHTPGDRRFFVVVETP